ncbi:MAG: type IV pilin protein [Candidatus Saccharibacteria bacterium]|nr:type IV pilin protein [Candidatus Saccharibacteria bacterium]
MKQRGFTLVEVLVVIVVLAILLTIGAIGYQSWRRDAIRTSIETDLKSAAQAMEQYRTFNNTYPPGGQNAQIPNYKGGPINIVYIQTPGSDMSYFCLEGSNGPTGNVKMRLHSRDGLSDGACQ